MEQPSTGAVQDNVEAEMHEVGALRDEHPDWDEKSSEEKLAILEDREPEGEESDHNVMTKPFREHITDLINPNATASDSIEISSMAFGNDDTSPSVSDTGLINEVYRDTVDDHVDRSGEEYAATILIQSDEAVGLNLLEGGLVSQPNQGDANDMTINRVTFSDSRMNPKDADHAITVTMSIDVLDESEVV